MESSAVATGFSRWLASGSLFTGLHTDSLWREQQRTRTQETMSVVSSVVRKKKPQPHSLNGFQPPIPPKATSPCTIKGVPAPIQQFYFFSRPGPPSVLNRNRFFTLSFFPPSHFLGIFRKSSPALRVKYLYGTALFNDPEVPASLKNRFPKSVDPLDYSHIRVDIRRLYRDLFWKEYNGVDGVYVFDVGVVPRTPEELSQVRGFIKTALNSASKINIDKKTAEWNSKVNWKKIKWILESEGLDVPPDLELLSNAPHKVSRPKTAKKPKKQSPQSTPTQIKPTPKIKVDW